MLASIRSVVLVAILALAAALARADYMPSTCEVSSVMRQITNAAPWPARQEAGGFVLRNPFTFTPKDATAAVTWPAGTIAFFGGQAAFNDVWISSDNAVTWTLLSGRSFYTDGAYISNVLRDGTRTSVCAADDDTVFIVAGTFTVGTAAVKTSRVAKGDLRDWGVLTNSTGGTNQLFVPRERAACIVDSSKNVYVFGGNRLTPTPLYSTNDIWTSPEAGNAWTRLTAAAAWPIREGQNVVMHKTTNTNLSATGEVMIMANGLYVSSSSYRMNDVWLSTDRARSWQRVHASAEYPVRQDGSMAITKQGVLVVAAGDCGSECNLNDVWTSLDGGWTWGQCCRHCGYDNREDAVMLIDREGYLLIMSGSQTFPDKGLARDVWRSSFSFDDLAAVESNCGVKRSACGVGLQCIPGGYCPCAPEGQGVTMLPVDVAPWNSGRNEAGMATRNRPLTFMDVTQKPPVSTTFQSATIFFAGKSGSTYYNDVWASSDKGNTWYLISGTANGTTAGNGMLLRDNSRSADCFDSTGRMYLIGGTNTTTSAFSSSVWASDDGIDWAPMTLNAPFWAREAAMCSTDSRNQVFVFGGSVNVYTRANDVWKSQDGGRNWELMTQFAPWMARTQHDSCSFYSKALNKDVLYVLNGIYNSDPASDRNNDIWASIDDGRSWRQITAHAPYNSRQDSDTDADEDGIMILSGGDIGSNTPGNVNDIWASIDGGFTWGRCNASAGYTPREDQSVLIDHDGYLIMTGGDAPWVTASSNVVWRSEYSLKNLSYVAERCHLTIPSCGTGLNCWPSATQFCDKGCPITVRPTSSSSSSTGSNGDATSSSTGVEANPAVSSSSSSDDDRTSKGLAIGMAFLGLGVGLLVAACIAFVLCAGQRNMKGEHKSMRNTDGPESSVGPSRVELSQVDARETH